MIGSFPQAIEGERGVSGELGIVAAIASSIALLLILLVPLLWLAERSEKLLPVGGIAAMAALVGIGWAAARVGVGNAQKLISS